MALFSKRYTLLAFNFFKARVPRLLPYFEQLRAPLQRAKVGIAMDEYVAAYLLTNVLFLPAVAAVAYIYAASFLRADFAAAVAASLVTAILTAGGLFTFFMAYPQYKVRSLKEALDKHVAFAATHMATIAGMGVPPHVIFQMLGQFDEYGEIAKSCRDVSRNILVFGYDTISAISEEAQRTPSHKFKDLLWSFVATIRTGGDLRAMLIGKSKTLMEEQRRTEAKYIETLSMMAEIYSTVFVAGVVMIFVLVSIMGILGGLPVPIKLLLQFTTYLGVPIASIGFMLLIESSKPSGV